MARRKVAQEHIRKLTRMGGGRSVGLTLPIELIRQLGWRERQKVVVRRRGSTLQIKDWHT